MTEGTGAIPPSVDQIVQRFNSVPVRATRPLLLGGLGALKVVRRFNWTSEGARELLKIDGPFLLASNHVSHADTAAILGTLPSSIRRRTAVAAALDVFGPKAGGSMRSEWLQLLVAAAFHAFAFDRHGSPRRSIRTSVKLVDGGWNMLLYPEGTRSRSGTMGPFKAGIGLISRFTGRPVVPVHVSGGRQVLPNGRILPSAGHMVVRYGQPVSLQKGESLEAFTDRIREIVCELRDRQPEVAVVRPQGVKSAPLLARKA